MKKFLPLLLCLVLLFPALASCEISDGSEPPSPVSDFSYSENDGGGITVTKYNGNDDRVIIPQVISGKNVTILGSQAFTGSELSSVVIPDTVRQISHQAFSGCEKLSDVKIGSSTVSIGLGAFTGCKALTSLDLSSPSLKYIDSAAFANCEKLASVKFGDNIEQINDFAFSGCSSLTEVTLPKKLKQLEKGAFMGCTALEKVTIPSGMELYCTEDPSPFPDLSLKEVEFESGRERLVGYACFMNSADSNTKIIIPESVKKLSCSSFLLKGSAVIEFRGDCPEIVDKFPNFPYIEPNSPKLTIRYDPQTKGWDSCPWKDVYTLTPIS